MSHSRARVVWGAAGAAGLGLLFTLSGTSAAIADGDPTMTFDQASQTVEYGTAWGFNATVANAYTAQFGPGKMTATITGSPAGYTPTTYLYRTDMATLVAGVYETGNPYLPPGSYTVTVSTSPTYSDDPTTTGTAQLTIEPVKLAVATHVTTDPANPRNAVVAAQLTGHFVDQGGGEGGSDISRLTPAGSWNISIKDSTGAVVQNVTAERKAGGYNVATSFSWLDVPAGEYTAVGSFTPSGTDASNFAVSPSAPITFTAPGAAPGDASTAAPAPPQQSASADEGPTAPAWVLVAAGLVTLLLLALVTVQIVQLVRTRGAAAGGDPLTAPHHAAGRGVR